MLDFPGFIFLIFILISTNLNAETVLTQSIGTSAFQVVTSREVRATELISRSLEKEMKDPTIEISQDNANHALLEVAVFREAQNISAVKLDVQDINSLMATAKSRLQKNNDWKRLEVTDEELKAWIERKKIVTEFVKLKVTSLTAIVTDQEIQDYYEKNRLKFGSTPLEDQRANIRLFLQKESQRQRVQEWMNALKTKYQIRNDLVDLRTSMESNATLDEKHNENGSSKTKKTANPKK